MKALSVRQPWASLIAEGYKTIEIRSRPWQYRGPLVICSTAKPSPDAWIDGADGKRLKLPCGVAVCVVEMVDSRPLTPRDAKAAGFTWRLTKRDCEGQWAWVLANAREVKHVPVKGQLQPWDWQGEPL